MRQKFHRSRRRGIAVRWIVCARIHPFIHSTNKIHSIGTPRLVKQTNRKQNTQRVRERERKKPEARIATITNRPTGTVCGISVELAEKHSRIDGWIGE